MARKTLLLAVSAVVALLLSGCFKELPVPQYKIKQVTPAKMAKPPQVKPPGAAVIEKLKGKPESRLKTSKTAPSPGLKVSESRRIEELEKRSDVLSKRLDLYEQRIRELEKRLEMAK